MAMLNNQRVYSKECGHALWLNPHTTSNTEENHSLHTRLSSLAECYLMMICQTRCLQYAQLVNIATSSCLVSPIPIFAVHTIDYNHPYQWKIIKNETWNIHSRGYFHSLLLQVDSYHLISERPVAWYPWLVFLFVFRIHGPFMVHSKHRCNFAMVASILASCFACSPISSTSCTGWSRRCGEASGWGKDADGWYNIYIYMCMIWYVWYKLKNIIICSMW